VTALTVREEHLVDGVHLDERGATLVAEQVWARLATVLG
jgi:hypothetical protein